MSNSRHSPSLRSISVDKDHPCWRIPTDFFIASHWLEWSSCPFAVTLLIFSGVDHSTSPVLTTSRVVFYLNFYWSLASKSLHIHQTLLIGPLPWRHTPQLIVMHVVFRSLLKVFEYDAKQACKQLSLSVLTATLQVNGLADVYRSKGWWRWWRQLDYWSHKPYKAPVKPSPPTNQHPFFTGRMPFLSPNRQCQSTEGKISHSMDLLTPSSPGGLPTLSLTTNSSWLPWGGFPCLSSVLWCQYPSAVQ